MDLLTQDEGFIKEIVRISNKHYTFEDCFKKILLLLVKKTKSKCGCIIAEFENTDRLLSHSSCAVNCPIHESLFAFYSEPESSEVFFGDREYILIPELKSSSNFSFAEHEKDGVIYPISDGNGSYGIISLCGATQNQLISNTVISFIVKAYIEKKHNLLEKYYLVETEITELKNAKKNYNKISSIILDKINLFSVTLLMYDTTRYCLDIITSDSQFPIAVNKMLKNLHVDLGSNSLMNSTFAGLDTPAVYDSETVLDLVSRANKNNFVENISETLGHGIGDLLISPGIDTKDEKKFFLVTIKKKSQRFMKSQIVFIKKLAKIVSLTVEKEMSELVHFQNADRIDIAQKISRRIIDDSDINVVADFIRQELGLHSCIVFLINRLEKKLKTEGFSSKITKSNYRIMESIDINLDSIYGAGYSQTELHQTKLGKIGEYVKSIENCGIMESDVLATLRMYQDHNVIQVPLFDSYRRLQGFFLSIMEPDQHMDKSDVELFKELSSKIANAFEIRKSIYFDSLTELPNLKRLRPLIVDKLISSEAFSLVLCKIINIKEIVIARGDDIVDKCMISIAKKIKKTLLKQTSNILLGRNSGEASFILVHPSINRKELEQFSDELKECITETMKINRNSINLYTNIGICHSTDIWDSDTVFNYSKLAIQSIADQRNTFCIFDTRMQEEYLQEQELEEDIRESLIEKHFIAHYQPKVQCDGIIIGYEALVRWQRKNKLEYPVSFIDKIERMGMMRTLFGIVFKYICKEISTSRKINSVSINISPTQLGEKEHFIDVVSSIVTSYAIDPPLITFEFVETAMLNREYYSTIKELKKIGFRISIDDFGTGYARYKTLIDLFNQGFVNELKIDKVFVDDIESTGNQNFIRSISYLAKEFDISIVVEGVETIQQFSRIKSLNPDIIIQGWLVSKALPLKEVEILNVERIVEMLMDPSETLS